MHLLACKNTSFHQTDIRPSVLQCFSCVDVLPNKVYVCLCVCLKPYAVEEGKKWLCLKGRWRISLYWNLDSFAIYAMCICAKLHMWLCIYVLVVPGYKLLCAHCCHSKSLSRLTFRLWPLSERSRQTILEWKGRRLRNPLASAAK